LVGELKKNINRNQKYSQNNECNDMDTCLDTPKVIDEVTLQVIDKVETQNIIDEVETPKVIDEVETPKVIDEVETPKFNDVVETQNLIEEQSHDSSQSNNTNPVTDSNMESYNSNMNQNSMMIEDTDSHLVVNTSHEFIDQGNNQNKRIIEKILTALDEISSNDMISRNRSLLVELKSYIQKQLDLQISMDSSIKKLLEKGKSSRNSNCRW